jgi:hypothetical protein
MRWTSRAVVKDELGHTRSSVGLLGPPVNGTWRFSLFDREKETQGDQEGKNKTQEEKETKTGRKQPGHKGPSLGLSCHKHLLLTYLPQSASSLLHILLSQG